jgi:hypothetical protein
MMRRASASLDDLGAFGACRQLREEFGTDDRLRLGLAQRPESPRRMALR